MLSPRHILLFQYALSQYSLPNCVFVNQSIAFGMSYGFFSHMNLKLQQDKYVLILNLGDVFFSISLMSFNEKILTMHYETCTSSIGGREFTLAFKEYVQKMNNLYVKEPSIWKVIEEDLLFTLCK